MIRVYNTLSKKKETFTPVNEKKVGIYLCGPTVYKESHIGHMVGPVIFDTIKRYLCYSGYDVTFIVNITDVDDKLIAEANKRGMEMAEVAAESTAAMRTRSRATSTSRSASATSTVSYRTVRLICCKVTVEVWRRSNGRRPTSRFGNRPSRASPHGTVPGDRADRAGISSARR